MKASRVFAIILGVLLLLPGLGMLLGGGALTLAYAFGRDDGYFEASLDRLQSPTVAITAEDLDLAADPGDPDWLLDALDVDIRLQVTPVGDDDELFIGIGPEDDVDTYLAGVAHDEIDEIDGRSPDYRRRGGRDEIDPPVGQEFWTATAAGPGDQELLWEAQSGRWAVVLMNTDGSRGVAADVDVGAKSAFVLPLALILLGVGAALTGGAIALIVTATSRHRAERLREESSLPPPGVAPLTAGAVDDEAVTAEPVRLTAELDSDLSPWKWLVKWFLAIPHVIVLVFLWIALVVTTVIAGFSILFTGRYPGGIFDFNVGVLRWTWRVGYYAGPGGLGTDRYPPFSLDDDPGYPARLHIDPPGELSRGLVLVKWWLLAIPHYLIVAVFLGWEISGPGEDAQVIPGLLTVLVVIAGFILLFTGRYRRSLFDLIVGLNRWVYRVVAYAVLMTDQYPPFRLDQGGGESASHPRNHPGGGDLAGDVEG
ncbi:MAG: DUF4389 domain-containing protein [Acidimicrobiia bacterium]|nr:DUF4389 domain-containing protein [Acidimicrobiia bacterium]